MHHHGTETANPVEQNINGMEYWRSLEQLADTPAMREMISKEFPGYDAEGMLSTTRRRFLKLMGASLALAGLTLNGCRRWPQEKLAPYSSNPRDRIPGVAEQYATVLELSGVATGLLVTSFDGRPIKIEGNPSHPFAWTVKGKKGAADAIAQASVLELYDPNRSALVVDRTAKKGAGDDKAEAAEATGKPSTWDAFTTIASNHFASLKGRGEGFAVLSEATSSPSVLDLKKRLLTTFPQAKWYEYEPVSYDSELEAAKLAFGQPLRTQLHLDKANVVLLLDADPLGEHPAHVRYASDWSERRRSADAKNPEMSRVYLAETTFSITGTVADERLPVDPSRLYAIARAVASQLGVAGISSGETLSAGEKRFVDAAAKDLKQAGKNALVAAGPAASVQAQVLAHAINEKLGSVGTTITLLEDPTATNRPSHAEAVVDLADAIKANKVGTLLILGGNPVYDAPEDLAFATLIEKVPMSIRLGLYDDETSQACKWHLPRAHYLESWGDSRAWDGTASIVQPLILPLYGGKSVIELLALVINEKNGLTAGDQIVRRTWAALVKGSNDIEFRKALQEGLLAGTRYKTAEAKVKAATYPPSEPRPQNMYLRFIADRQVHDGRFANNGWLQESPDTLTKLVWDNAAMISKSDADRLKATTGDVIRITVPWRKDPLEIAAYVLPGQPVGVVTLPLGYGRTAAGTVGSKLGFDTYRLRHSKSPLVAGGAVLGTTSETYKLVSTQDHHIMDAIGAKATSKRAGEKGESGKIINEVEFSEYAHAAHQKPSVRTLPLQLFEPPHSFRDSHAWGMSIDMNTCIGCNACVVACQAENNIPIVGKDEASNHRAMHWIRIDRYFKGAAEDPGIEVVHQPMTCQHCENAPCEQVCPVAATMHDSEGLNTMVYNRCIGTRYCSNNCPYKVRRFNYFDYHSKNPRETAPSWLGLPDTQQLDTIDKIKRMVFNPDVTIRMRGVMEKCTYCVQRIHGAVIPKRNAGGDVADGDIMTACEQACPTQAIIFGNLNDPDARVSKLHQNRRAYSVLHEELDTRPRTRYLSKLRNPMEMASTEEGEPKHGEPKHGEPAPAGPAHEG